MKNLLILHEDDGMIYGREKDQVRAFGQMMLLCTLAPSYGREPTFNVAERMQAAIASDSYLIAFEAGENDGDLAQPVGFITWGMLSKPCAVIFEERLRMLHSSEMKSGKQLWVIDLVAPMGHGNHTLNAMFEQFPGEPSAENTRYRDKVWRRGTMKREVPARALVKAKKE